MQSKTYLLRNMQIFHAKKKHQDRNGKSKLALQAKFNIKADKLIGINVKKSLYTNIKNTDLVL